jgi:N-methylhydantoinase A
MGLLQTDVRHLYLRSAVGILSSYPVADINGIYSELRRRALDDVAEEGLDLAALRLKQQLDLRYLHQGYHLTIDGPDGEVTEQDKPAIKAAFDDLHRRNYGASAPDEDAELVTLRLLAEIPVPHLQLPRIMPGTGRIAEARIGARPLFDLVRGEFADAEVYDRARLRADDRLDGPAIIEQYDSTTVVLDGQTLTVDAVGNLLISEKGR